MKKRRMRIMNTDNREEVKKNWKELRKKGVYGGIIKPLIGYWKSKPFEAVSILVFWVFVFYSMFSLLQAINYDMIYCDCTNDEFDGKLMENYNRYVDWVNEGVTENKGINENFSFGLGVELTERQRSKIYCDYDLKRWWNESINTKVDNIFNNFVKVFLKKR